MKRQLTCLLAATALLATPVGAQLSALSGGAQVHAKPHVAVPATTAAIGQPAKKKTSTAQLAARSAKVETRVTKKTVRRQHVAPMRQAWLSFKRGRASAAHPETNRSSSAAVAHPSTGGTSASRIHKHIQKRAALHNQGVAPSPRPHDHRKHDAAASPRPKPATRTGHRGR